MGTIQNCHLIKKQDIPMTAGKEREIATPVVVGYVGRMFVQQKVDTKSLTSLPGD